MRFCLPPRCGLCRLNLVLDHDEIIVVRESGNSRRLRYRSLIIEHNTIYISCNGDCSVDEQAAGCHLECYHFVSDQAKRLSIIRAASYQYNPLRAQDERRRLWLYSRWSYFIQQKYRLPPEVCDYIASDCLGHFAIINTIVSLDEVRSTRPIRISQTLTARYTVFEGIGYIASISNSASSSASNTLPAIFVAEDHMGIRGVLEGIDSLQRNETQACAGIWWRIARARTRLRTKTDGIKLRLQMANLLSTMFWVIPRFLPQTLRWDSLQNVHRSIHPPQMSVLLLNNPAIFAYSVRFGLGITAIYAHTQGEGTCFYQSITSPCGVWLYAPVHHGEYILEIWKCQGFNPRQQALIFGTNKGRYLIFGVYQIHMYPHIWTLLGQPKTQGSHLFYETSSHGIIRLALDLPAPDPISSPPSLQRPSAVLEHMPVEDFFYTWAILDKIRSVRPCYNHQEGIRVITGLLFSDVDEHEFCVGEVRYNSLGDQKRVNKPEKLWLAFTTLEGGPRVTQMETSDPLEKAGGVCWFDVLWEGKLEWWFSDRQCRIYHGKRSSPQTRQCFGRNHG